MRIFFLLFILFPIAELFLLIEVGSRIGAFPTILLVLLTAVTGLVTLRSQGFITMLKARQRLMQGEVPGREILEGFLIAIGGIMLMVPGFITDACGLLLLVPWTRKAIFNWLIRSGNIQMWSKTGGAASFSRGNRPPGAEDIYEGEFTREQRPREPLDAPDKDRNPP